MQRHMEVADLQGNGADEGRFKVGFSQAKDYLPLHLMADRLHDARVPH